MNKRVITTSLALALTMTVVLAVGKTTNFEGAVERSTSENLDSIGVDADIKFDEEVQIPATKIGDLALLNNTIAISAEIDEKEMILGQKSTEDSLPGKASTTSLMNSLARVQSALDLLEQVAARTESAVVALVKQRAAQ
jgi:uncharacterized membrane protein